jgi:hypothetical protein
MVALISETSQTQPAKAHTFAFIHRSIWKMTDCVAGTPLEMPFLSLRNLYAVIDIAAALPGDYLE